MEVNDVEHARKSTYSGNGGADCVTVGQSPDVIAAMDSKLGDRSPVLAFPRDTWRAFTDQLKHGQNAL